MTLARRVSLILIGLCCAFVLAVLLPRTPDRKVYRIGWEDDPPDEVVGPNGTPTGLAVEVVNEAARRRSIQLQWVRRDESSEAALRSGQVDLWPLMTITPARQKVLHFSTPYLESVVCLLVRKRDGHKRVEDLAHATISYLRLPINVVLSRVHLPEAHLVPEATPRQLVESVCRHEVEAAFIEEDAVITDLMGGTSCGDVALGTIPLPQSRIRLGIGSTFAAAAAADALRDEVDSMLVEGRLAEVFTRWGYLSTRSVQSVESLRDARRREHWLAGAAASFAAFLALAMWLTFRYRRAERALRRSVDESRRMEAQVRLMAQALRSANECISISDVNDCLLYVNDAFLRTYGYEASELIGRHVDMVRSPRHTPELGERISAATSLNGWRGELWNRAKSGREFPILLTTSRVQDENCEVIARVGVARDITEQKQAEDALRESERRFREFLRTVNLAAVIVDVQDTVVFCNDYFLRTTGWSREQVMGRNAEELLLPEHRAQHAERLRDMVANGRSIPFVESAILTAEGKARWVEWNTTVLRDLDGRVAGIACIGADVTEHRALKEQYLQAQKLESIGRLAGGVAHDFNNLLTVINGYADILLGRLTQDARLRGFCEQIRQAGCRASGLTQQLLAFSRKQVSQPKPLDLNALIAESEDMFRRLLGEDIELVTILQPRLGKVMADSGQLHQLLMNLAVNARDAMPEGGRLAIETRAVDGPPSAAAEGVDLPRGPYTQLSVTDNGTGMDEETRLHIFEPFFTTKPKGKGTGLGLSTVYGIVRQSHGWVTVESAPGKGAAFHIYLPETRSAPGEDPENHMEAPARGSETILVVEDQESVRSLVANILQDDGYRVIAAGDGRTALQLAGTQPIALVLTDVVMPGMNGRQLVDRLKQVLPGVKVLYMSGHADNVIATRGVLDPGISLIAKPFTPVSLTSRIREVLDS